MDTTSKYILMSGKAVEIQERKPEVGDFYAWPEKVQKEVDVLNEMVMTVLFGDSKYSDTVATCLLRQDQLQEIVGKSLSWLVWDFEEFTEGMTDNSFFEGKSMEQLWLAFVMKEKYNKVWNGKDWVHEKN